MSRRNPNRARLSAEWLEERITPLADLVILAGRVHNVGPDESGEFSIREYYSPTADLGAPSLQTLWVRDYFEGPLVPDFNPTSGEFVPAGQGPNFLNGLYNSASSAVLLNPQLREKSDGGPNDFSDESTWTAEYKLLNEYSGLLGYGGRYPGREGYRIFQLGGVLSLTQWGEWANFGFGIGNPAKYDLTGASIRIPIPPTKPGDSFEVNFSVENLGPLDAPPRAVEFFLRDDTDFTNAGTPLGVANIPTIPLNRTSEIQTQRLTLPKTGLPPGTYYVGMRVIDAFVGADFGRAPESINNNSRGLGIDTVRIEVESTTQPPMPEPPMPQPPSTLPDLRGWTLSASPTTAKPGDTITVRASLRNNGAALNDPLNVLVFGSRDADIGAGDFPLAIYRLQGAPARSVSPEVTFDVVLPLEPTYSGDYTIGIVIDPEGVIAESDEGNNRNLGYAIDKVLIRVIPATLPAVPVGGGPPAPDPTPDPALEPPKPAPPSPLLDVDFTVVGGPGGTLRVVAPDGAVAFTLDPFPGFAGEVRTASGANGAVVAGTGPGSATRVLLIDPATGKATLDFRPFEAAFTGGVFVSTGDLFGTGTPDIVTTPDQGGGPRVQIRDGRTGEIRADFFGIDDPNFFGGARTAVADVTGDGIPDLIVAAGFGGGPRVTVFDGASLRAGGRRVVADFFVFEQSLRNGVYVTAGDLNGDRFADLIVGGGPGGGPRVLALSGKDLTLGSSTPAVLANFFAGNESNRGGVRVAVKDLDGDPLADIVIGPGEGGGSTVTAYAGKTIRPSETPPVLFTFDDPDAGANGVFVG